MSGSRLLMTVILLCGLLMMTAVDCTEAAPAQPEVRIVASTFPVFLFTRNIVNGAPGVVVESMLPASMGCPHDYVLTPGDMEKISRANIFVANGLGLEEFLGAPLERANPKVVLVDSSSNIRDVIEGGHEHADESGEGPEHNHGERAEPEHASEAHHPEHGDGHPHEHAGPNPHLFASPRMAAMMVRNIASALVVADPANSALYKSNSAAYAEALETLAEEARVVGSKLNNRRVITQHAVFDYLARDMGLEIEAVVREDPGMEPSAAEMLQLVRIIRQKKVGALFTEPQYPARVGETVAREAKIPVAVLDPVATGLEGAPLDYYQQAMRKNLETLRKTLGSTGN
ncbi:MAG: metal ABC transporter substrate-binding protein [Syntrophobacteraceae bacterium]